MTIPYPTGPREVVFSSSGDRTRAADAATVASGSSIASRATALAESLFATLFPADCRFCGAPLLSISRLPVCGNCLDTIRPIAGGVCAICGERLVGPHAFTGKGSEPLCGLCRRIDQVFAKASAYGSYAGGLRDLIHLLKYQQVRPAANLLGLMLAEVIAALEPHFRDAGLIVVPVPLHATKQRQRAFNQSELIAQAALKLSFRRGLRHVLRTERGAFRVVKPEEVLGHEILLVDDVFTTGTTASECAPVLRRAGATRVWVATVTRTFKEDTQFAHLEPETDSAMSMAAHG